MGGGGHLRPRAGELHPRIPAVDRRAARAGLRHHHVHPGGHAGRGLPVQPGDPAGEPEVLHDRRGTRAGKSAGARTRGCRRNPWGRPLHVPHAGCPGALRLGLRRHSAGLGHLDHAAEGGRPVPLAAGLAARRLGAS
ncbi:hypothetical protein G6F51_014363 [Rhizopus arrhizus]|uniref:Uncharacterized protein n=1 Tax=Rhizopus oryzae TaxID=64495 RepID=A0A9P6XMT2_RHIOR|nr:hypothetical protein G6F51_014363 [Rhizopus arrhizus]